MATNSTAQLGRVLATLSNDVNNSKDASSPNETVEQDVIFSSETIKNEGGYLVRRKNYALNSFVIDHPVYGYVNSPTLLIDGGYETVPLISFPLTFPINWYPSGYYDLYIENYPL